MSMFAKRHYEAIARVMRERLGQIGGTPAGRHDHEGTVRALAELFASDNGCFDRTRFYDACGGFGTPRKRISNV